MARRDADRTPYRANVADAIDILNVRDDARETIVSSVSPSGVVG